MNKKLFFIIFISLFSRIFASNFFSGDAGLCASFVNTKPYSFKPELFFSGFLNGQFALTNSLSVRGDVSFFTADLYENSLTDETEARFQINEISASYVKSFLWTSHSLSFFNGYFETIGSQQFIGRTLGTENFSSPLTLTYLGLRGCGVYDLHGIGGAYSITFKSLPISSGIVISRNRDPEEAEMNADWRFACAFKYLSLDFLAGIGAPTYTKNDAGEDVFLLIDTVYYHGGVDLLLGNKFSPVSLYGQAGFEYAPVKKTEKTEDLEISDTYILGELRFNMGGTKLYLTGFNIPLEKLGKFIFIEDSLGAGLTLFNDAFATKKRDFTLGINGTVSFVEKYVTDIHDFKRDEVKDYMNIKVSPFTEINASKGKLQIIFQADIMKLKRGDSDNFKLHIGYKKEL